jgi:UDP-N-acetylglucosamine--N-acetylmuramyl-(pentapeptide) pyrophosphoryl-undecaprenol N-acetylglucosamine transferase
MMRNIRVIIAGGGTGGHLFPGIAIAKEFKNRFEKSKVLFVVGHRKMESEILSRYGYETRSVEVGGIKGKGLKKKISVLFKLPGSILKTMSILKEFSPSMVLGMGGYSSGPICVAAKLKRIPIAIHEQNSYPGLTNRLLSRFADRAFISFEESRKYIKTKLQVLTGNPVREELFLKRPKNKEENNRFKILVVGGSQGAMAINRAFAEALEYICKKGKKVAVNHQTGQTDYERVLNDYKNRGLTGELHPFIHDMAEAYGRSDLVIGRAGATTIFELAALGKPSILIPYPYAANLHQDTNAKALVGVGGAEMIFQRDLNGKGLAEILMKYMGNRKALEDMGWNARKIARPNAAKTIVDQLLGMVSQ